MSAIDEALRQLGVGDVKNAAASVALSKAIDTFGIDQAGPMGKVIKDVVGSSLPPILRDPNAGGISIPGVGGDWTSVHYADDMIAHQPKFKFLFKVAFKGFGDSTFYYYVQRCDKPKVQFVHQEVNYYNFRTKVLTQTTFSPLTVTFYDEIGNSVNQFFVEYMKKVSGQGSGSWGIDKGFGNASSTKYYAGNKGYSSGREIVIEQVFANGVLSNRFKFKNPRIEVFDFDELNIEENGVNVMSCTFHYDAIECETVTHDTIHSWGETDLLRGGGSSGIPNAGASVIAEAGKVLPQSANGLGIGTGGVPLPNVDAVKSMYDTATAALNKIPDTLKDLVPGSSLGNIVASVKNTVSSAYDTVSRNVSETYNSIMNGSNLSFPAEQASIPAPSASDIYVDIT
jgi:hypothetical protein